MAFTVYPRDPAALKKSGLSLFFFLFFFLSFYMLGGMLGLCWYLGFTSGWENKRNVPADCVKGYRLFQGASHTKTDIKFCRD